VKAALIPPRGYERTALASDIHLVLPLPPLVKNEDYLSAYYQAREKGDYLILDNGCAEGQLVDGRTLLRFASQIGAHEIVAPDVMDCGPCTVKATQAWVSEYRNQIRDYSIMGVLQGRTQIDWQRTLRAYSEMDEITAIGVPKVHVRTDGSDARLRLVRAIHNEYPGRFKIHLLGLNGIFPTEVALLQFPDYVRSMDSSQPYKLTEAGKTLSMTEAWAKRRLDYFENVHPVPMQLLVANLKTFKRWAEEGLVESGTSRSRL
jgi:hypothetical protein